MAQVYFIGAGPGDPDLITVKGQRLLQEADVVIYTGSLVNAEVLQWAERADIYNSASMDLPSVMEVIKNAVALHKKVVRLHTGDPSIYGAIQEQMDILKQKGISFEVVPGVSSFVAAAASLQQELTLPGVTQTIVLTRLEGRTPVPEKERLSELAKHGTTMCIFLSVQDIEEVVQQLMMGYPMNTPVAVVQKASWPDQKVVRGTLQNISSKVKDAGISKTAMIIVGQVFSGEYEKSKLYDPTFTHGCREGKA